jgi:hypothetical protein
MNSDEQLYFLAAVSLVEWVLRLSKVKGKGKGKEIPLQASTGHWASRRLRLPDFKTVGT